MRTLIALGFATYLIVSSGCQKATATFSSVAPTGGFTGQVNNDPAPKELPEFVVAVAAPKDLPALYKGEDFSKLDADDLAILARQAAAKDDYKRALAAQFWNVKKGDEGFYDLACYYARNQLHDEAFYWLQKAAREEGVDAQHASQDEDLTTLRRDPRYGQVAQFLNRCSSYWQQSNKTVSLVYVPKKFDKTKPSPVIVCLHGRGSSPDHFFGEGTQDMADALGIPFVSVSGTRPTGPKRFVWAVEPVADAKRIDAALKEASDRITVAPGKVIAIGFSEGAQMALEVAARDPEKYAGAIGMSPGADFMLNRATASEKLKERRFVVTIGGAEHPGNVSLARQDRDWFKKQGVEVQHVSFPGIGHTLPRDFDERLPKWVAFILGK